MARKLEFMRLPTVMRADVNPKGHDADAIAASIDRFGYVEPLILDERTGKLVAGHGRLDDLARRADAGETPPEGIEVDDDETWLLPVFRGWASKTDDEAHALGVALNRLVERGGWQDHDLLSLLADLAQSEGGLVGLGFDETDVQDLTALLGPPPTLDDLRERHGEPDGTEMWPVIRAKVPHDVRVRYLTLVAGIDGETDQFVHVVELAEAQVAKPLRKTRDA
jgi:hypothetical protein